MSSGEPPEVELAEPERVAGTVRLRLSVRHPQARPTVVVLVTGDDGATWWPVGVDPDDEIVVNEAHLPSRARCRFRVVATAGISATTVDSGPIDLPPACPGSRRS